MKTKPDLSALHEAAGEAQWLEREQQIAAQLNKAFNEAPKKGISRGAGIKQVFKGYVNELKKEFDAITQPPADYQQWSETKRAAWQLKTGKAFEGMHSQIKDWAELLPDGELKDKIAKMPAYGDPIDYNDPVTRKRLSQQMLELLNHDRIQRDYIHHLRQLHQPLNDSLSAYEVTRKHADDLSSSAIDGLNGLLLHADYSPEGYLGKRVSYFLRKTMFWLASLAVPELRQEVGPEANNGPGGRTLMPGPGGSMFPIPDQGTSDNRQLIPV